MKPETTLKDVKKPFALRHEPDKHYAAYGITLGVNRTIDVQIKEWMKWDKLEPFIVKAINEKWERDFGEPLRWEFTGGSKDGCITVILQCPKCKYCVQHYRTIYYNYCPSCGVRLLPPGEDEK